MKASRQNARGLAFSSLAPSRAGRNPQRSALFKYRAARALARREEPVSKKITRYLFRWLVNAPALRRGRWIRLRFCGRFLRGYLRVYRARWRVYYSPQPGQTALPRSRRSHGRATLHLHLPVVGVAGLLRPSCKTSRANCSVRQRDRCTIADAYRSIDQQTHREYLNRS